MKAAPCPSRSVEFLNATWDGTVRELATAWTLRKKGVEARCTIVTHPLGHELRLFCETDLVRTQVFLDRAEVFDGAIEWRAAMKAKGWQ